MTPNTNGTYSVDDAARALLRALRATAEPPKLLLTAKETSTSLAVSEKSLWLNTAPRGACIPVIRLGERSLRYSVRALEEWIARQPAATPEMKDAAHS